MEWPSAGAGPARDFVGYGERPPVFRWPDGSGVAVSVVVNYEEGAEYNLLDGDGLNDTWGEHSATIEPAWRDLGTETHFEFGSRVGVWRLARLFDEYEIPVSFGACAVALERNPELCGWLREREHGWSATGTAGRTTGSSAGRKRAPGCASRSSRSR